MSSNNLNDFLFCFTDAIKEYEVFIKFYGKLASVLQVHNLCPHLVSKNLLNTTEVEELHVISTSVKKAVYVLRKISSSLQAGQTQSFYIFLSIVEEYGNAASTQVVSEMKYEIESFKGNLNHLCKVCYMHHLKDDIFIP